MRPIRTELDPDCWLEERQNWLVPAEAERVFERLQQELVWEQRSIQLFGRQVLQPRLIAWAGQCSYRYSGATLEPRSIHPVLSDLLARAAACTGIAFNHVLLNRYRDGTDSMGMHSDDEPELGRDPQVAVLSLGEARPLIFAAKAAGQTLRREVIMEAGSLMLMGGRCQHAFRHGLPKRRRLRGERISATFRLLHSDPSRG